VLTTACLIVALLLALLWGAKEHNRARDWSRAHLSVSARLHEAQRQGEAERRRSDALLVRLARTQGEAEALAEAALGVSMLGQLDALREPEIRQSGEI